MKKESKEELHARMAAQIKLHGTKDLDGMRSTSFPDLSRATFYRHMKEVRERLEEDAAGHSTGEIRMVQKIIRARMRNDQVQSGLKDNLIAASPSVVRDMAGAAAGDLFDFISTFNQLISDADMMRSHAVVVDPESGAEKLKNPMLMGKSMQLRLDLIDTYIKTNALVWNMERIQALYQAVIEEVSKVDTSTAHAIVTRIRALNNRTGMTINANI